MDENIKRIQKGAREYFKNADLLLHGFSLDCITVVIKRKLMLIWDFDAITGKCNEGSYLIPETTREMVKKMVFHCGEEKFNALLKNNITLVVH